MTPFRQAALLLACFVLLSALALAQSEPFTIGIHDACDPGTWIGASSFDSHYSVPSLLPWLLRMDRYGPR